MKLKKNIIIFFLLPGIFSCNENLKEKSTGTFSPKVAEVKELLVSEDSTAIPKKIPVDESKLKKIPAGKSLIVPVNNNIRIAGKPNIVIATVPGVITPGTDTFLSPSKIPTVEKPVPAGMPETFTAKEMTFKIPNPYSFGSFGKIHGLKHSIVSCLLQDKKGNIWICTAAGVSRYDGRSFTHFTEKEGLVHNDVRSIMQDKSGNIWFGTLGGGVSKYDGYSFTNFTEKDGLTNNYVVSMEEDRLGNIWMATWGGVTKYDGKSFTNFTQKQGLVNNYVYTVIEDKAGNIWMGTKDGVSKYNGTSFTNFTEKEGLGKNEVCSILQDKTGNLWFGTYGKGVSIFNGELFTNFTENEGLINNDVFSLIEDKVGNIWIGTHYGLSKYNGRSFTNFTQAQGLSNDNIYCILQDKSGNLWFGTAGGGVSKYNPYSFTHITETEGLKKNYMFSIYEDKLGNIWFGTWRGGVSQYDGRSIKSYTDKQGLTDNDVRSICQDKYGSLWFATYKGVCKFDGHSFIHFTEKDGLINNDVNTIKEDNSGHLWFGTVTGASKYDGKSFTNFTARQGLTNNAVNCIIQDRSGNLWFGVSEGLFKYDGASFTHILDNDGLINTDIISILEDKKGNFWLGTGGRGVFKYDGRLITQITLREGLINNDVTSLLEDKSGNIWFGTRFGLSKLSAGSASLFSEKVKEGVIYECDVFFKNYDYADGFLGVGCNGDVLLQSNDGYIWIGTNGGITTIDPSGELKDTIPPDIQITAVKLAAENIDWVKLSQNKDSSILLSNGMRVRDFKFTGLNKWYHFPVNLSLAYDNNYISFDFAGITMSQPQNVKYQYQLEGIDKNWNALTSLTSASYGNLPQGIYTFKVKAMNSEGYWSNEINYLFTIRPPWWQTWWFRALFIIALLASVFFVVRFIYFYQLRKQKIILEKQLAVQYERQRISSDLHDEIGSTLSSINIYAGLAKKETDKEPFLESINHNVNDVVNKLDDLVWSINPKYDNILSIINRLQSYAEPITQAGGIFFEIKNELHVADIKLAAETKHNIYLVLKELINNAVKHAQCKHIYVKFLLLQKKLLLSVSDDGRGFDKATVREDRNGLANITQRVAAMKGSISTGTGAGNGTQTKIVIPV